MSYRKQWDAFVLYLEEHPGAFDKQERLGIKWADLEIKRLRTVREDCMKVADYYSRNSSVARSIRDTIRSMK